MNTLKIPLAILLARTQSDVAVTSPGPPSDPSPQFYDEVNMQHSIKTAPYEFHDDAKFQRSTSLQSPPKFHDEVNGQHSTNNASPPISPNISRFAKKSNPI
ncbi:hypothetical protein ACFX15_030599 [Malus domestica]